MHHLHWLPTNYQKTFYLILKRYILISFIIFIYYLCVERQQLFKHNESFRGKYNKLRLCILAHDSKFFPQTRTVPSESRPNQQQPGLSGCSGSNGTQPGRAGPDKITQPYQPHSTEMAVQKLPNKTKERRFKKFPWIHYGHGVNGVLWFYCVKAFEVEKSSKTKIADFS